MNKQLVSNSAIASSDLSPIGVSRCQELMENYLWQFDLTAKEVRAVDLIAGEAGVTVQVNGDFYQGAIDFVELADGIAVSAASHTLLDTEYSKTSVDTGGVIVTKDILLIRLPVSGELSTGYDDSSVVEAPHIITMARVNKGMRYTSHFNHTGHFSSVLIQVCPNALLPFLGLSQAQGEEYLRYYPEALLALPELREYEVSRAVTTLVEKLYFPKLTGSHYLIHLRAYTQLLLNQLFVEHHVLSKKQGGTEWSRSQRNALWRAREILLEKVVEPPSLMQLAKAVGLNRNILNRGFRDQFGTTVAQFSKEVKLQKAWVLLQSTNLSVTEVADRVGYGYVNNLIAAFHKRFGVSPKQARLYPERVKLF